MPQHKTLFHFFADLRTQRRKKLKSVFANALQIQNSRQPNNKNSTVKRGCNHLTGVQSLTLCKRHENNSNFCLT